MGATTNLALGCKYYRYLDNEELEVVRLIKIKNNDCYVLKTDKGERKTVNYEEILKYIKLNPDGYVSFSIVGLDKGIQDVIIALHRMEDVKNGDKIPYLVARQNIFDIFSQLLEKQEGIQHIGTCVTKDTCPPDVEFKISLTCNSMIKLDVINVYIDDTLDTILSHINTLNYDNVLNKLYSLLDQTKTIGSCKSVRELLLFHDFRSDFLRAWNIAPVNFKVESSDDSRLPLEQVRVVEGLIKYEIKDHLCIPYDKDIDLKSIQQDYILISDKDEKVYVLSYIKGQYINREYSALDDKRDMDMMQQLANKKNGVVY